MKWYNVWYKDNSGWHSVRSQEGSTNLNSLENAQKCAEHIKLTTDAKEIRIKCITEEVVESYFVKSEEEALMDELVHLNELRECTKNLRDLYSSGPLKDSNKVSYADVSLANINNSIIDVEKKLKKFSDHQNETVA
jgi:DNA relaxase NicK